MKRTATRVIEPRVIWLTITRNFWVKPALLKKNYLPEPVVVLAPPPSLGRSVSGSCQPCHRYTTSPASSRNRPNRNRKQMYFTCGCDAIRISGSMQKRYGSLSSRMIRILKEFFVVIHSSIAVWGVLMGKNCEKGVIKSPYKVKKINCNVKKN